MCLFVAYENMELPARSAVSHGGGWLLSTQRLIIAALNESHMHKVDMLDVGPRGQTGEKASANLSPRGQTVVTSLAWCFLILPMRRASVRNAGVSPPPPHTHTHPAPAITGMALVTAVIST